MITHTMAAIGCAVLLQGMTPESFVQRTHEVLIAMHVDLEEAVGSIKSIDAEKKIFILKTSEGELKITVNEKTVYLLDGRPSTMDEAIAKDRNAMVTHEKGVATRVEVKTS